MLYVKEFDEDPALLQNAAVGNESDSGNAATRAAAHAGYNQLLAVNTSIPRREFHLDLSSSSSPTEAITIRPITYAANTSTQSTSIAPVSHSTLSSSIRRAKQILVDLFLPLGFPHSVDASYLPYQFYDSLQGLCSYLRGVVSTSAVLTAAGVGNAEANAMGAAMSKSCRFSHIELWIHSSFFGVNPDCEF